MAQSHGIGFLPSAPSVLLTFRAPSRKFVSIHPFITRLQLTHDRGYRARGGGETSEANGTNERTNDTINTLNCGIKYNAGEM